MNLEAAGKVAISVTRLYEGGGATWDFDGAGLSMGLLQWNIKAGTLQSPLIQFSKTPKALQILGQANLDSLLSMLRSTREAQMAWARGINDYPNKRLKAPWDSLLKAVIATQEWQAIEMGATKPYLETAREDTKCSGVNSVRSFCVFFDLAVQNGGMGSYLKLGLSAAKPLLRGMVKSGMVNNTPADKAWLIACVAARSVMTYLHSPKFASNVFKRKLGIIEGGYNWRKGDLPQASPQVDFSDSSFGVTDAPIEDL